MVQDLGLIAVLITTTASAIIGLISQIQHSRCTNISCCGGMFSCDRQVPVEPENMVELRENNLTN